MKTGAGRVKLTIAYDGTRYHGWQVQKNADTVQKRLGDALCGLFNEKIDVTGCSRTDSGVHALGFCCHFDKSSPFPTAHLPAALNARLPQDISVLKASDVPGDFHARYDCKSKTYRYLIYNSSERSPFYINRAEFFSGSLDIGIMRSEAESLIGTHDFRAFMAAGSKIEDTVRTVYSVSLEKASELICFEICGDGFLYNMVRIIAGTLIDAGRGKAKMPMSDIISSRRRENAGKTAAPCGLYLKQVTY